jgi:hypothetical protein
VFRSKVPLNVTVWSVHSRRSSVMLIRALIGAKGVQTMAIKINDYSISLAISDRIVAPARFSAALAMQTRP